MKVGDKLFITDAGGILKPASIIWLENRIYMRNSSLGIAM